MPIVNTFLSNETSANGLDSELTSMLTKMGYILPLESAQRVLGEALGIENPEAEVDPTNRRTFRQMEYFRYMALETRETWATFFH